MPRVRRLLRRETRSTRCRSLGGPVSARANRSRADRAIERRRSPARPRARAVGRPRERRAVEQRRRHREPRRHARAVRAVGVHDVEVDPALGAPAGRRDAVQVGEARAVRRPHRRGVAAGGRLGERARCGALGVADADALLADVRDRARAEAQRGAGGVCGWPAVVVAAARSTRTSAARTATMTATPASILRTPGIVPDARRLSRAAGPPRPARRGGRPTACRPRSSSRSRRRAARGSPESASRARRAAPSTSCARSSCARCLATAWRLIGRRAASSVAVLGLAAGDRAQDRAPRRVGERGEDGLLAIGAGASRARRGRRRARRRSQRAAPSRAS